MKIIKICFITREYAHPDMGKTGGIGVFLKQFTNELKAHDFDITIFSFGMQGVRFDDNGVNVIKIKDLSNFNEWIKAPLRTYKVPGYITVKLILEFLNRLYISIYLSLFVWRHKFDLIEFHDYGGDAPYFIGGLPKVVRCHGSAWSLHQFMGYVNRISDSIFEKQFFKRFHKHVVAVSQYAANTTQQAFMLQNKPMVIYNGVNLPDLSLKQPYLEAPTIPFSIFYFGSIRERKGIDIACAIFNELCHKFPESSFHVMGNNNNDYWNTHAKPILSAKAVERTTYYGSIPNDEVNVYLQKAHVVVFPSFGENFSIALLEVMALGKIAITSKIPSFEEIIVHEQNGFMATKKEDFITIISKLFESYACLEQLSTNAITTIKTQFEIKKIIEENVAYYKSLV